VTGSGYFDGSVDYLAVASDASFGFGTGDFTMECWLFPLTNPGTYSGIISTLNSSPTLGVGLGTDQSGNISFSINSDAGSAFNSNSTGVPYDLNVWQHIAITRESGTVRIWLNGSQIGTDKTNTGDCGATDDVVVGRLFTDVNQQYTDGYISNARIIKGTALYTSAFTPPLIAHTQPVRSPETVT